MYLKSVFVLCSCILLQACSTLPTRQPVHTSYATEINTSQTYLFKIFTPLKQQHPNLTGFHILFDPADALVSRLQLIERAEKTLDLQYYIWDNDKVGALALEALLRAADRGVKIRLLVDDNNSKGLEAAYYALSQHANIEVRLFNPHRFRRMRALDWILDFNRMTRRMHNKTFIADQEVALIGGRNMSNQYYNAGESFQFSDMDVILVGHTVTDIQSSFDEYWNHEYAYPVEQISAHKKNKLSYQSLRKQLDTHWFHSAVQDYLNILSASLTFDTWFNENLNFEWVEAHIVKDSADKIKTKTPEEDHLSFQLNHMLQVPKESVDLVSAYFVPEKKGADLLKGLAQSGVEVRILTNSFKANDVPPVHAFYSKYRKELLADNVQLYEYLPVLPVTLTRNKREFLLGKSKFNRAGYSRSSLHAKFLAVDQKQVFIGSFNFDPRSAYINTEIGVVLNSPMLAGVIHQTLNDDIMKYAYRVQLDDQHNLQWSKQTPTGEVIYKKEPLINWWQKIGLKFLSWLPIEKQM